MPATIDAREGRLDFHFRAGNEVTIELTFEPAGWTTGRAFVATLDGEDLIVTPDGDVITVTASAAVTNIPLGAPVTWEFSEDGGNLLISGLWTPSIAGNMAPATLERVVSVAGATASATVNVLGGPGHVINGGGWDNDEDDFYNGGGW